MIRKLILSAVIATVTLTGLSMSASTAKAAAPFDKDRGSDRDFHRRQFEVLVECGHRWENRGTYRDRYEAKRAAQRLRHKGFRVEIKKCQEEVSAQKESDRGTPNCRPFSSVPAAGRIPFRPSATQRIKSATGGWFLSDARRRARGAAMQAESRPPNCIGWHQTEA